MPTPEQATIVAVCGSPGAGKTTTATAVAGALGLTLLTRDEISAGLHLSGVSRDSSRGRAEALFVETACRFANAATSVVVENSVLSRDLVDGLRAAGARIVAVHVVADPSVIGQRLRDRTERGRTVGGIRPGDVVLLDLFERGEMRASIFEPPPGVHEVVRVDTSAGGPPDVSSVVGALHRTAAESGRRDAPCGTPGVNSPG
ncbi:AAA family ATPase [Actinoplanes sp. NPDC020271]|uniref:AAA family ATPase n=1 Tax=Actinoplanes sp. NPDC020271 TaxID=3363896 RepID=UPI00378CFC0F